MSHSWRVFVSLLLAAAITFVGVQAFMWSVHDPSDWLTAVVIVGLPVTALASTVNFLDSDLVYWGSIVSGFILWASVGYLGVRHLWPGPTMRSSATRETHAP